MKRRSPLLTGMLGLFGTVAQLHTSPAWAEDASAAETAAARSLAVEGLKLAQANNCADAVPKLERAEKLYHSAVVASRLGECYVSVGRLVEGTEVLRKVLREPQPADAPAGLAKALDRAQRALDAAKPRIAGLTIKVAAVADMRVKIDGNVLQSALVDSEVPTDPGEHSIEVSAPGFLRVGSRVTLAEGEKKSVSLTLARDPNAVVAAAPSGDTGANHPTSSPAARSEAAAPAHAAEPTAPKREPSRAAAYVSLGIGAAGVVTGSVLGILTMQQHTDLQGRCPNDVCTPSQQGDLDSAKRLGNFSTIAFGVGGAGLVLGTVLLFTGGSSSDADHARVAPKRTFAGLSDPRIAVGPTHIELGADF